MRKTLFFLILAIAGGTGFLYSAPALAQADAVGGLAQAQGKPEATGPLTIAMTYSRLTRQPPDFEGWGKLMQAYKDASDFEKPGILENEVQQMKESYRLLTGAEPLVVETPVKSLSNYDNNNKGFFVENFRSSTFFPAHYAGKSYAIVPQDIMDKQWMKIEDPETVAAIQKAITSASGGMLSMVVMLSPQYADASSPASIDGENYWPIAANVRKMSLYAPGGDTPLWQGYDSVSRDQTHEKIMNLFQQQ